MKHTVTHEGKTFEVDIPGVIAEADVAARYIPKDVVEGIVQGRLEQFGRGHVKVDGLDEAGKKALAVKLGLKLAGDGEGGDLGTKLESAKANWVATDLKPVLAQLEGLKGEIEGSRKERLYDAIVTAAAKAGVLDSVLDTGGGKAAIVAMHELRFVFDEKTRKWYVKGEDGNPAYSTTPTKDKPFKDPAEFIGEWVKLPTSKPFVGTTTQAGPDLGRGGRSTGAPGVVDGSDPLTFGRNIEKIAKGEVVVQ
jgi:hypothetical protein